MNRRIRRRREGFCQARESSGGPSREWILRKIYTDVSKPLWDSLNDSSTQGCMDKQSKLFVSSSAQIVDPTGTNLSIREHCIAHQSYTNENHDFMPNDPRINIEILNLNPLTVRYTAPHGWSASVVNAQGCDKVEGLVSQDWIVRLDSADNKFKFVQFYTPAISNYPSTFDTSNLCNLTTGWRQNTAPSSSSAPIASNYFENPGGNI